MSRWVLSLSIVAAFGCKSKEPTAPPPEPEPAAEGEHDVAESAREAGREVAEAIDEAAETAVEVGREASEAVGRTVDDALGTPSPPPEDDDAPES